MIVIKNPIIPTKGYAAMLTLFILWIRNDLNYDFESDKRKMNHEKIHCYQQIEIWILAILLAVSLCFFANLSWWWMLATPIIPLAIYVVCWIIELILPPMNSAYGNICFESEAIYNEHKLSYGRKRIPFSWLKYIPNKKYPYISHKERAIMFPMED